MQRVHGKRPRHWALEILDLEGDAEAKKLAEVPEAERALVETHVRVIRAAKAQRAKRERDLLHSRDGRRDG